MIKEIFLACPFVGYNPYEKVHAVLCTDIRRPQTTAALALSYSHVYLDLITFNNCVFLPHIPSVQSYHTSNSGLE